MTPDTFEIYINSRALKNITIKPHGSIFGPTQEEYVHFKGLPIGQILKTQSTDSRNREVKNKNIVIYLNKLPSTHHEINLKYVEAFIADLPEAVLLYELDCEQHELLTLNYQETKVLDLIGLDLMPLKHQLKGFLLVKHAI